MKKGLFLFSVLIILIACGSAAAQPKVCGCYFDNETEPQNIKVRFKGLLQFVPAIKGMYISKDTFLRARAPASARLYCDNGAGSVKLEQLNGKNSAPPVPCLSSPAGVANVVGDKIIDIPRKQGEQGQH